VAHRQTGDVTECNLVFDDIDDKDEAQRILNSDIPALLGNLNATIWHTARSTPAHPRIRVMVSARGISVAQYPAAVATVAGRLGLTHVNTESKIAVQPMFLPGQFKGDTEDHVVYLKTDGQEFDPSMLATTVPNQPASQTTPLPDPGILSDIEYLRAPVEEITVEDIEEALSKLDASCSMQEWVETGMALRHQFGDAAGYAIWDAWSATSKDKYQGPAETAARWGTFKEHPDGRAPVTIRSVVKAATEAGWNDDKLSGRLFEGVRDWIRNPARASEQLLDQGAKRIAKVGALIDPLSQRVLVNDLYAATKGRGLKGPSMADIAKEVKRLSGVAQRAAIKPPSWVAGIVFLTSPNLFYRVAEDQKLRPEVVDLIYPSPLPEMRTREYLVRQASIPVVENLRYDPAQPKRIFSARGKSYVNTYRASYPKADPTLRQKGGDLWMEHCTNLRGPAYVTTMTNWVAFLVQHPGLKIRWVPALQGAVGCGKGLEAYTITVTIGNSNVQRLAAEHAMEGSHNGWAAGFQLTVIDEMFDGGHNRRQVMNRFKPLISDGMISVRNLYEPVTTVPNITNYLMYTNHHDAFAVHDEDRRYWYLESPLQTAAHVQAMGGAAYFRRLFADAERYAAGLRSFFETWKITPDFDASGRAPITAAFRQLSNLTASPLAAAVQDVLQDEPHPLVRQDLVSTTSLRDAMPTQNLPAFSDQALAAVLREAGFTYMGRHRVDGSRHRLWATDPKAPVLQQANERAEIL
jgi:hypothetical protein